MAGVLSCPGVRDEMGLFNRSKMGGYSGYFIILHNLFRREAPEGPEGPKTPERLRTPHPRPPGRWSEAGPINLHDFTHSSMETNQVHHVDGGHPQLREEVATPQAQGVVA